MTYQRFLDTLDGRAPQCRNNGERGTRRTLGSVSEEPCQNW